MGELLSAIGGLIAGMAAAGSLALTWRSSPRFRKPELHTIEVSHSNWVIPKESIDFSGAPSIDAGVGRVDDWLYSQGAMPMSWHIRSVLFAGKANSLVVTGVQVGLIQISGTAMKSNVLTQLGGNGYLRRRAYIKIGRGGAQVKLFDEDNRELESLGLNLNQGDALEFMFYVEADTPGVPYEFSLKINVLADGKRMTLPVDGGRVFRISAGLPDADSHEYPGANMMY